VFQEIEQHIIAAAERALAGKFSLPIKVVLEQPKQAAFGELAIPVAFQLARQLKKPPKAIAEELVGAMGAIEGVSALEIAGNGYINVRLDRAKYAASLLSPVSPKAVESERPKIVVEHTNINPNKAAHIGHLRNAVLGDTFVRMLRRAGKRVEVQNYIDNTGVQVADVVVGFHYLAKNTIEDVRRMIPHRGIRDVLEYLDRSMREDWEASGEAPDGDLSEGLEDLLEPPAQERFDYRCWNLYAEVSSHYKKHPETLEWRATTLHAIEAGEGELAELAHLVADSIVASHVETMYRLGVEYDVLPRESEILHLQFWATAFELLKARKAIYLETEGKNKGCWVMPSSAFRAHNDAPADDAAAAEESEDAEDSSKVIVRSNGTVTYVGKDIAYQLWKFGLLGKDFYYRKWSRYPDGHQLWVTTDVPQPDAAPHFGGADEVYNVIDSRQSYLQDVVLAGLRALGFNQQADRSVHFSYEMVALSPRTCVEMGIPLSEEDKRKPYVEVSGRKGLGVKADDLLDKLIQTALTEVGSRHKDAAPQERIAVAKNIAVGALRYFMLKFTRNSVIAFDFHEALSFEGETGPYVQYAAVRAGNILKKYEERRGVLPPFAATLGAADLGSLLASEDLWQLLLAASKLDHAVGRAIQSGEPAHIAKFAFQLARTFNTFYHDYQVISEQDEMRRAFLLWLTQYVRGQLVATLDVLGIEQPAYM
jgi:arginyl-tRNA synthetase